MEFVALWLRKVVRNLTEYFTIIQSHNETSIGVSELREICRQSRPTDFLQLKIALEKTFFDFSIFDTFSQSSDLECVDPPEPLAGGDYTYDEDNPSKTFRDTFMYTCLIARLFPGTDQPYDHVVTSECQWNKTWTVVNVIIEKEKITSLTSSLSIGG